MFNEKEFKLLSELQKTESPCISIYIPTYRAGNYQEDRLRFKNALSEAVSQLMDGQYFPNKKMEKQEALRYLTPAYDLLDNESFWKYMSEGLAVFINEHHFSYHVAPIDFDSFVYVQDHFYLRHLTPLLSNDNRFFVLALSQNEVRFFEGRENFITPVIIEDLVPNGIEEMASTGNSTTNLQVRSGGGNQAIFHGHGGGKDDKIENLKKYFRSIDDGLMTMLHDETAPMIIYSVDSHIPVFKEISNYSNIYNNNITGNPDNEDPALIHEKAWSIIQPYFAEEKQEAKLSFQQNLVEGKASFSIHEIIPSAIHGKVEVLFTDKETKTVWGNFDKKKNTITIHQERRPDSICLLNESAIATCQNGGKVYNLSRAEMPKMVAPANATFRY